MRSHLGHHTADVDRDVVVCGHGNLFTLALHRLDRVRHLVGCAHRVDVAQPEAVRSGVSVSGSSGDRGHLEDLLLHIVLTVALFDLLVSEQRRQVHVRNGEVLLGARSGGELLGPDVAFRRLFKIDNLRQDVVRELEQRQTRDLLFFIGGSARVAVTRTGFEESKYTKSVSIENTI